MAFASAFCRSFSSFSCFFRAFSTSRSANVSFRFLESEDAMSDFEGLSTGVDPSSVRGVLAALRAGDTDRERVPVRGVLRSSTGGVIEEE